jgi:long-chain acyl-CoA synthetase
MSGPLRWPDRSASVVHILAAAAAHAPGAEALVCGAARLSYGAYWHAVQAEARRLRETGLAPGDRVAVILPNGPEIAIASMAAMAAGAVLVPLNPLYTAHELAYILGDAEPGVVISEPGHAATGDALDRLGAAPARLAPRIDTSGSRAPVLLPEAGTLGMIQYTGGTTGRPKGVMLGHDAIAANVAQREARLPTRPDDRVLIMTPLYHSYATAMGLSLAANCAGTLVILPRYRAEDALNTVAAERISLFAGAPVIYTDLLGHPGLEAADLSSLRLCYSGSAALSREVLERWERRVGCPIVEGFGQTEAGPVLTYMPPEGQRRPGTVGPALDGTELQIVDTASGTAPLPAGEPGEVRARGPQIMRGYWRKPEETAAALRDGWLHTGDIGALDADGTLTILDRKKDMVIVSGFNVYPREIEEELHAFAGVQQAAVVGRPDARTGEALVAFIVAAPGAAPREDALRAFLETRLARYKLPAEIRRLDALPKTPVGKTDKAALRALCQGAAPGDSRA